LLSVGATLGLGFGLLPNRFQLCQALLCFDRTAIGLSLDLKTRCFRCLSLCFFFRFLFCRLNLSAAAFKFRFGLL
jgi:hypothetical protein